MSEISDVFDEDSDQLVRYLLLLVDEDIQLEVISTWTVAQKGSACLWAGGMYANDRGNNTIRVPDRPSFLPTREDAHA